VLKENKPANGCRVNAILAHVKDHYLRQSCILIKQVAQDLKAVLRSCCVGHIEILIHRRLDDGMSRTTVGWHTSSQGLLHDALILSFSQLVMMRNWDMLELCLLQKSSFVTSLSSRIDAESLDFHLIPSHVCGAFCLATVNSRHGAVYMP
jgi:hypothetical protein